MWKICAIINGKWKRTVLCESCYVTRWFLHNSVQCCKQKSCNVPLKPISWSWIQLAHNPWPCNILYSYGKFLTSSQLSLDDSVPNGCVSLLEIRRCFPGKRRRDAVPMSNRFFRLKQLIVQQTQEEPSFRRTKAKAALLPTQLIYMWENYLLIHTKPASNNNSSSSFRTTTALFTEKHVPSEAAAVVIIITCSQSNFHFWQQFRSNSFYPFFATKHCTAPTAKHLPLFWQLYITQMPFHLQSNPYL